MNGGIEQPLIKPGRSSKICTEPSLASCFVLLHSSWGMHFSKIESYYLILCGVGMLEGQSVLI